MVDVGIGGVLKLVGDGESSFTADVPPLKRYDPSEVVLVFGGMPIQNGYVKDTFITCERIERSFKMNVGIDGEVARRRMTDMSGRVTLRLRAGSSYNDVLSAAVVSDEVSGLIAVPLIVRDFSGRSICVAPFAFIEGHPEVSYSAGESQREWVILCNKLFMTSGGSDSV
jgi:hypothetical protein